jgi:D-alanyl-D-alanine carboxypeptidase
MTDNRVELPLGEMQRKFTGLIGQLITWAYANGFELTFGEAYRTPEQCALNAETGAGIVHSLHMVRLAVDLNLFIAGAYQDDTGKYEPLGVYWESLGGVWGGRFSRRDGNHFSLAWEGRK